MFEKVKRALANRGRVNKAEETIESAEQLRDVLKEMGVNAPVYDLSEVDLGKTLQELRPKDREQK